MTREKKRERAGEGGKKGRRGGRGVYRSVCWRGSTAANSVRNQSATTIKGICGAKNGKVDGRVVKNEETRK